MRATTRGVGFLVIRPIKLTPAEVSVNRGIRPHR
jgi:hypothetical protein